MNTFTPALRYRYRAELDPRWTNVQTRALLALIGCLLCVPWFFIATSGASRAISTPLGELLAWGIPHLLLFGLWASTAVYTVFQALRILFLGNSPMDDAPAESNIWWTHRRVEARMASWLVGIFFAVGMLLLVMYPHGNGATVREVYLQREVLEIGVVHFFIASFAALGHRLWVLVRMIGFGYRL